MNDDSNSSPLESKRREDTEGEYWLARELFRLLGYKNWERFAVAIERAMISVRAAGDTVEHHFRASSKNSPGSEGRPGEDYRLTRYAAYMIAMNGDVRKPEIAHAQAYFAIKTREAEIAPVAVVDKWSDHPDVIATKRWLETNERVTRVEITLDEHGREIKRVETTTTEKVTGIEERVQSLELELAPKVKAWELFENSKGWIPGTNLAHLYGSSLPDFYDFLTQHGVFYKPGAQQGDGNTIRQEWRDIVKLFIDHRRDRYGNKLPQFDLAPYFSPRAVGKIYALIEKNGWGVIQGWRDRTLKEGRPRKGGKLPTRQEIMDLATLQVKSEKDLKAPPDSLY